MGFSFRARPDKAGILENQYTIARGESKYGGRNAEATIAAITSINHTIQVAAREFCRKKGKRGTFRENGAAPWAGGLFRFWDV